MMTVDARTAAQPRAHRRERRPRVGRAGIDRRHRRQLAGGSHPRRHRAGDRRSRPRRRQVRRARHAQGSRAVRVGGGGPRHDDDRVPPARRSPTSAARSAWPATAFTSTRSPAAPRALYGFTGALSFADWREPAFNVQLESDDARLVNNDNADLTVDTRLTLKGPFRHAAVGGDMTITRGMIYAPRRNRASEHWSDPAIRDSSISSTRRASSRNASSRCVAAVWRTSP